MAKRNRKRSAPASQKSGFMYGVLAGIVVVGAVIFFLGRRDDAPASRQTAALPPPAPVQQQPPPPPPVFSEAEVAAATRIEGEEARRLLESGAAVAIDVRDVQSFAASHIPGALQIPLSYVQGEIPYFPRDRKLITYCT